MGRPGGLTGSPPPSLTNERDTRASEAMTLSETHHEIRRVARRFADEVVRPAARHSTAMKAFPADIYRRMGELGRSASPRR